MLERTLTLTLTADWSMSWMGMADWSKDLRPPKSLCLCAKFSLVRPRYIKVDILYFLHIHRTANYYTFTLWQVIDGNWAHKCLHSNKIVFTSNITVLHVYFQAQPTELWSHLLRDHVADCSHVPPACIWCHALPPTSADDTISGRFWQLLWRYWAG